MIKSELLAVMKRLYDVPSLNVREDGDGQAGIVTTTVITDPAAFVQEHEREQLELGSKA